MQPGEAEYHIFSVDIQSVAFVIIQGEEMIHQERKVP